MFYLMMHSTHFILRLYGIRHMVKDHSDRERGNPLLIGKSSLCGSSRFPRYLERENRKGKGS